MQSARTFSRFREAAIKVTFLRKWTICEGNKTTTNSRYVAAKKVLKIYYIVGRDNSRPTFCGGYDSVAEEYKCRGLLLLFSDCLVVEANIEVSVLNC